MATHVQAFRVVPAPLAPTWAAVSHLRAVEDWHPNVARASVLTEQGSGVGASRRVEFQDGNTVVETVVEEREHEFTTMKMSELPLMKDAVVTIATKAKSADETEVTFSIRYSLKYGPLGWLLDTLMMKRMFGKVFGVALAGLSYHLETGNLVDDSVPELAA
jgi:hypothetical protein